MTTESLNLDSQFHKTKYSKKDIKSLLLTDIFQLITELNQPSYRAFQILNWLYKKRATSWSAMTDLPKQLRYQLDQMFTITTIQPVKLQTASDNTTKFLWQLPDGLLIESVYLPATYAQDGTISDRKTICISTQVGCAIRCKFCASGLYGLKRNLTSSEIVEQILATERWLSARDSVQLPSHSRFIRNVVLMGMGEPLANFEAVICALHIINSHWGIGIGARRITISTVGIPDRIIQLAEIKQQFRLALSLHAPDDATRSEIIPIAKKYPLKEILEACRYYSIKKKKMITLEYLLIDKFNCEPNQIRELARIAKVLRAKINLIPYNPVDFFSWNRPSEATIQSVLQILKGLGVPTTLRYEKGTEIDAACGQLRLRTLEMEGL